MIKRFVLLISFLLVLCSCSGYDSGVRKALRKSGDNRQELERVLKHYKETCEDEKYEAAGFLIRTMPGQYSLRGASLDRYYSELDSYYNRGNTNALYLYAFLDSLFSELSFRDLKKEYDLKHIDSHYLMDRIEEAFSVRYPKWYDDIPFSVFCDYLLPYRVGTEELEDWFTDYHFRFGPTLDSLYMGKDVSLSDFCSAVNKLFLEPHTGYANYPAGKPSPRPSSLVRIIGGTCEDYLGLFTYIGRSYGIPVAQDYTPQWGNHSKSHTWCAIVIRDTTYHYSIGEPLLHAKEKHFAYRLVKVFREMNTEQDASLTLRAGQRRVPPNLDNSKLIDVTDVYSDVTDVKISNLFLENRSRYVYLTCFDDRTWVAVDGGKREGSSVTIKNMGYPCVFLPMYYKAGHLSPAEYPILVAGPDATRYLKPDCDHRQTVHLTRKFMETRAWDFVDSLRGGHFELADNPHFREALKFNIPEDVGYNYQTLDVPEGRRFRYIRYVPREKSMGNIAELEVYGPADKTQKIVGTVIGNYESTDSLHLMTKIVDGNTLSYAMCKATQKDSWVGLDLGKAMEIDRICYLPRSDDNFIRDGEKYELCYWDKDGWVSLGYKVGSRETQELVYDNVPSNALLILHNHTKGKEERIFTYENGKQIWW